MKRLSLLILIFAILSLTFFLLLVFLRTPFSLYGLMSNQDAIDVLTSLVLIPVYWLMFKMVTRDKAGLVDEIVFMVMAALWVTGQGMHLSANSINNLIGNLAKNQVIDVSSTDIYKLTYFYDEYLSHYLWHIGVIGFAALLIYESWRYPSKEKTDWRMVAPAGIIYGLTWFAIINEGNTLLLGFPFVVGVTLLVLIWGREKLAKQPVLAFYYATSLPRNEDFLMPAQGRLPQTCDVAARKPR